jgi:hypothetical protein
MSSTSSTAATVAVQDDGAAVTWANPTYAQGEANGSGAQTAAISNTQVTKVLLFTDFNFSTGANEIPDDAIIDGIVFTPTRKRVA